MRSLKILLLALILVVLVVLAVANRGPVTLNLLPEGMNRVMPLAVQLPLFVVILLSVVAGMVVGYLFEWLREHKHRRQAVRNARQAERLEREVGRLRRDSGRHHDDVLALLQR
jgi:uncharacterized integral membrane protein